MKLNTVDLHSKYIKKIKHNGFTLIELLIVIAILGTLAAIAVPAYTSYIDNTRVTRAKSEIIMIEKEIISFELENGRFPDDLSEIGLNNMLDPYGNKYQYQPSTYINIKGKNVSPKNRRKDHNLVPVNTDFDLYSMGKDGDSVAPFTAKKSRDDIVRANNGQFVGLVSSY